jgi:hypothetical protein
VLDIPGSGLQKAGTPLERSPAMAARSSSSRATASISTARCAPRRAAPNAAGGTLALALEAPLYLTSIDGPATCCGTANSSLR